MTRESGGIPDPEPVDLEPIDLDPAHFERVRRERAPAARSWRARLLWALAAAVVAVGVALVLTKRDHGSARRASATTTVPVRVANVDRVAAAGVALRDGLAQLAVE